MVEIDLRLLHQDLCAEAARQGLSWRKLAAATGVSPSGLSRLKAGHGPSLENFAALTTWLRVDPRRYFKTVPQS